MIESSEKGRERHRNFYSYNDNLKMRNHRYTKIIVTCTGYFNDCNGLHKTIGDSFIFIQRFKDMPHFSSNLHTT